MKFPREFYIPKTYSERRSTLAPDAVAYVGEMAGKAYAMGFVAKQAKPAFHYSYNSAQRMEAHLAQWFKERGEGAAHAAQVKAERKAARAMPHNFKVGEILVASWGYDQTNIDFYQVTRIVGPHTVELTPIGHQNVTDTGYMTGTCEAAPGQFCGEPSLHRASADGSVKMASYKYAWRWDGQPKRWSSYA